MITRPEEDSESIRELSLFQSTELQTSLLVYARMVLNALVKAESLPAHPELSPELALLQPGLFITLTARKTLRGCIGHITGKSDVLSAIRELCYSSAFEDPRFYPVQIEELPHIKIEISILTRPQAIADWKGIQLGRHGVLMHNRGHQAVFLPQVPLEQGWDLASTLNALSTKSGLSQESWHDPGCRFEVFEAIHFGEL